MTVILVSHSMEDIAKYVDRIIVMNKGSVMFNDVPKCLHTTKNWRVWDLRHHR